MQHCGEVILSMITSLAELVEKHGGMRIVLSVGCFDLLHVGHINHLSQAKAMGDILVVGVTGDRHIEKGPGRPLFPEYQRAILLDALKFVDYVIIMDSSSAVELIQTLRPSVYVKGPDYAAGEDHAGNLDTERRAVEAIGGCLRFTNGAKQSSTELIDRIGLTTNSQFPYYI